MGAASHAWRPSPSTPAPVVGSRYVPTGASFAPKAAGYYGDCCAVRVQQLTADAPDLYSPPDMPNTLTRDRTRV